MRFLCLERRGVLGVVANRQDAGMDAGVKRFDTSVKDLRETRHLSNVADRKPVCSEPCACRRWQSTLPPGHVRYEPDPPSRIYR